MAGKTGEPPMTVFEGEKWPSFISDWAARWYNFHYEWFNNFQGPIQISCFDRLVHDPVEEVGHWLDFLDLDHRRLGCINHDPVGQFYRKKTHDYSHLFPVKGNFGQRLSYVYLKSLLLYMNSKYNQNHSSIDFKIIDNFIRFCFLGANSYKKNDMTYLSSG